MITIHRLQSLDIGRKKSCSLGNKYCVICQRSESKNENECFLNWTKASTSMEADGIVEGFLKSVEMHGLKYNRLIGKCIF